MTISPHVQLSFGKGQYDRILEWMHNEGWTGSPDAFVRKKFLPLLEDAIPKKLS